ncbi:MAG: hypothetical protein JNM52_08935 [Betaproteobacteria bacterium]|nr:hypothetical protein [Betaproteobacteria bacterium]
MSESHLVAAYVAASLRLGEQLEGVRPLIAGKPRQALQLTQRLDGARRDDAPHIRNPPAELFNYHGHGGFGGIVIAGDKHGGLTFGALGGDHQCIPHRAECLDYLYNGIYAMLLAAQ